MERKISFTGDIICKREFLQCAKDANGNWNFDDFFAPLRNLFAKSDLVIGNLETPIAGEERGFVKDDFSFNAPVEFAQAVKDAGVGYVSTANNHLNDRGLPGLIATCKNLKKLGLPFSGTRVSRRDNRCDLLEVGGVRIGILCYSYFSNWLLFRPYHANFLQDRKKILMIKQRLKKEYKKFRRQIPALAGAMGLLRKARVKTGVLPPKETYHTVAGAVHCADMSPAKYVTKGRKREVAREIERLRKAGADLIVMYAHLGGQFNPKPEKCVVDYVKWFFEQGVNAVVINHEHLVQEADFSKLRSDNQFVAYCLGNFLGGSGVYYPPFGSQVEYSILLHMYVDEETKRIRCSFSTLKTIQTEDGKFSVVPVFDLVNACQDEEEKAKLIDDNLKVYNAFMKTEKTSVEILEEYPCAS